MKKIWLLTTLLAITLLFAGCFEKDIPLESECSLWESCEIIQEDEYTWYYFIAGTPRSIPSMTEFMVIDPWNTLLHSGSIVSMPITWFENWDIVKIYYWWDNTELQKAYSRHYWPTRIAAPYLTTKIWSLKDELFIPRDNSQYELNPEDQNEPIITSYSDVCVMYDYTSDTTIYTYTFEDLWIKISTPKCWDEMIQNKWENIFVREGWTIRFGDEYLTVYTKDPNQSLQDVINERHLNPWCSMEDWQYYISFSWTDGQWYFIYPTIWGRSSSEPTSCYSDDTDDSMPYGSPSIYYFQPQKNPNIYLKLRVAGDCAPGPCSIFWKIEIL